MNGTYLLNEIEWYRLVLNLLGNLAQVSLSVTSHLFYCLKEAFRLKLQFWPVQTVHSIEAERSKNREDESQATQSICQQHYKKMPKMDEFMSLNNTALVDVH